MTQAEMEAELKRLADAVTYLAVQVERHDREISTKAQPAGCPELVTRCGTPPSWRAM